MAGPPHLRPKGFRGGEGWGERTLALRRSHSRVLRFKNFTVPHAPERPPTPWGPQGLAVLLPSPTGSIPERGQPAGRSHGKQSEISLRGVPFSCLDGAFIEIETEIIFSPFYFNKDIPRHYLQAHIIYLCYLAK